MAIHSGDAPTDEMPRDNEAHWGDARCRDVWGSFMTLLRSPEQAKLAELYSVGGGLSARYGELIDTADEALQRVLAETIRRRAPLLEQVRRAEQARGDLPPAPDYEINQVRVVTDRILAGLLGEDALTPRLARGEEAWLTLVRGARELDWSIEERELLEQLAERARQTIGQLRALS